MNWVRQFGSFDQDEGVAVAVDASGATWVVGMTSAALPGQTSAGMIDAYVRHLDPHGEERWTRQYGSYERDFAKGVAFDPAGGVYVVGQTFGTLAGQTSAGGWDAYVRKYDPAGQEIWTRQFGGGGADVSSGVDIDSQGNVVVAGSTRATLPGQQTAGEYDAFVRSFDRDGNTLWTRQFGTHNDDHAVALAIGPGDDIVVTGGTTGDVDGATPGDSFDAFLRRFDTQGHSLWDRQFGSVNDDYGLGVTLDGDGNTYIAGSTDGALPGQVSYGFTDAFVRKYSPTGAEVWAHQWGTAGLDDAEGIALDPDGNIDVSGRMDGNLPYQRPSGGPDVYVTELDAGGRELWTTRFGSEKIDYALDVAVDPKGSVYATGGTLGTMPGQPTPGRERDAFLVKFFG